jgi:hypothetical protein
LSVTVSYPLRVALAVLAAAPVSAALATPVFLIEIADTSAYRISHEQLVAMAPDLGDVASDRLALTVAGQPRYLHVHDGGDGRFGPGDSLTFYGERLQGKQSWFDTYAVNNVYRLAVSDAPVSVATPVAAGAGGALRRNLHLEQENLQIRLSNQWVQPDEEPDLWHWAKLTQVDPEPFRAPFSLPGLAADGTVRVELGFRGLSEVRLRGLKIEKPDDHVVEVLVNDLTVKVTRFESRHEHTFAFDLPASALKDGDNTLELRVPQRLLPGQSDALVDVVMFDFINLDYPVSGRLDSTPLPLTVAESEHGSPQTVTLTTTAADVESLALYGQDGSRHDGTPDGSAWRFGTLAAGKYQPVANGHYGIPANVRIEAGSRWRDVDKGYDYLLISHSTLRDAAHPLAEHHRGNGLRVAEIDVHDLYDEFNHGVVHPRAIRDFVAHAYHDWPAPRPRFVLLVGDASFDVRSDRAEDTRYAKWVNRELLAPGQFGEIPGGHYENTDKLAARRNLIPTWQYPSEEGHSAADNYFVAVDGDDWLPDLALGRFPVVEPEEVAGIVAKTLRYVNSTDFGDWRRQTLFTTDTSTHFQRESSRMAERLVSEGFQAQEVYAHKEETDNTAQINSLNDALNAGQLLVHFIGHGGRYIWRTGPPDLTRNHDLFTLDHVAHLQNGDRLPMVLSMTCYSAPFDHPSADSIGERFLREPDKGAIAVFAASWRNTPVPQFSDAAVNELMTPGATIGEALMRAKHAMTLKHQRTLVETYNLLGDPAVVLQRPSMPLKLEARAHGGTPRLHLQVDGDAAVNGRASVQWLDAAGAVVASIQREVRGRRASFVVPEPAIGAHEVRVHLTDYAGRRDGIAQLALTAETPVDIDVAVDSTHPHPSLASLRPPKASVPMPTAKAETSVGDVEPRIGETDRISASGTDVLN